MSERNPLPITVMASEDSHSSNRSGRIRRLLLRPLTSTSTSTRNPPHPTERSLLIPPLPPSKKKGLAFRTLGCASASSSQAFAPSSAAAAAIRSSADWHHQGKRSRRHRVKQKTKKKDRRGPAADVWCAPGIAFATADDPVDCVVPHHHPVPPGRGRPDTRRERPSVAWRQEHVSSFMDSPDDDPEAPFPGSPLLTNAHLRQHLRGGGTGRYRRSPGGLEEIMMFQTRYLLGAMDVYDRYRDMRLDVDSMSYEELLELGDRIGHVSTGLREEEIFRCLRNTKHSFFGASPFQVFPEIECKCSICQEEYEVNDEVGRLDCGHSYHMYCIKQWLLQKNACPVCKAPVT